jgi:hypothetical protein
MLIADNLKTPAASDLLPRSIEASTAVLKLCGERRCQQERMMA